MTVEQEQEINPEAARRKGRLPRVVRVYVFPAATGGCGV